MVASQTSCPSCGTVLTIMQESTPSLICKRCHSVLAYRNGALEQVGNAAPMICTECGAPLEVRAPGKTERVTCLQCRAIFDVTSGRPVHAGAQEDAPVRPVVPVGSPVHFGFTEYTLRGFLRRSTTDDLGTSY